MPRKQTIEVALSFQQALESKTADDLKGLLALLNSEQRFTRKAVIINAILQEMEGAKIQRLWHRLKDLQNEAIAEFVHSSKQ